GSALLSQCAALFSWGLVIGGCATGPKQTPEPTEALVPMFRPVARPSGEYDQQKTGRFVKVTTIPVSTTIFDLTYGDASLWLMGQKCLRLDPDTCHVVDSIPEASSCNVVVGEGAIWAVKLGLSGHEMLCIDPATKEARARIPGIGGWPAVGEGSV